MMEAAMLALLAACASAPEESAFYPPDEPGPYTPGVTTVTWTDARGKDLTAEVWFPTGETDCEPDPYPEIPMSGTACRWVDPLDGPWPLIAFSHGYSGIRYQSIFLTEYLATHGYVVVAPDHVHNTLLDLDEDAAGEVALERPGDVVSSVNELEAVFPGLADTSRYAMSGHSFGGWTALAVAGGIADMETLAAFCAENDGYDLCGIDIPEGGEVDTPPDDRVVSVLSMAPGGWYSFSDLSGMAPILLMGGEKDESESIEMEIEPLWERLPAARRLSVLAGAGHFAYTDICSIGPIADDCSEEEGGYINLDRAHEVIRAQAVAFFGVTLKQDDRYDEFLGPTEPEVTWEEEL
jgi:predicted dienelactone hydrolase